jgi:hypothetical protein
LNGSVRYTRSSSLARSARRGRRVRGRTPHIRRGCRRTDRARLETGGRRECSSRLGRSMSESRLRLGRAIGNRHSGDVTGDRLADLLDNRHQGLRTAPAVKADNIGAAGLKQLARLHDGYAVWGARYLTPSIDPTNGCITTTPKENNVTGFHSRAVARCSPLDRRACRRAQCGRLCCDAKADDGWPFATLEGHRAPKPSP